VQGASQATFLIWQVQGASAVSSSDEFQPPALGLSGAQACELPWRVRHEARLHVGVTTVFLCLTGGIAYCVDDLGVVRLEITVYL
jgi:hypothetical protein